MPTTTATISLLEEGHIESMISQKQQFQKHEYGIIFLDALQFRMSDT